MAFENISRTSLTGSYLSKEQVLEVISEACQISEYRGEKALLIVPDAPRSCPFGNHFQSIFGQVGTVTAALDLMIALGTHQPVNEEAICDPRL